MAHRCRWWGVHPISLGASGCGKATLAIIQRSLPDLIVLDVMMSDMNNFEVCKQPKAALNTADIPVIFLTATTDTRPYKEGGIEKSFAHILQSVNTQFDPALVEVFLSIEDETWATKAEWDAVEGGCVMNELIIYRATLLVFFT